MIDSIENSSENRSTQFVISSREIFDIERTEFISIEAFMRAAIAANGLVGKLVDFTSIAPLSGFDRDQHTNCGIRRSAS